MLPPPHEKEQGGRWMAAFLRQLLSWLNDLNINLTCYFGIINVNPRKLLKHRVGVQHNDKLYG